MKIVVTDGHTLNPGDLDWEKITAFGDLVVYDRTPKDQIIERCREAVIVLSNKTAFDRNTLNELNSLKMINVMATGFNVIDTVAAREKNIIVCNVPGYGTASVAQHTIALILELTNRVGLHTDSVKAGDWVTSADWAYSRTSLIELAGKTLGIVGLGNIGRQTARIAETLGMNILYHTPQKKQYVFYEYCGIDELFTRSDFISLHCPLNSANAGFVNAPLIKRMKPSAFLINTARGQLINEQELADALNEEKISGAALDVLSSEPPSKKNPLLSARNCLITPHNAWMTKEARQRIMNITATNIKSFLNNHPAHVVN
jgi:glycerate dehydrogenase